MNTVDFVVTSQGRIGRGVPGMKAIVVAGVYFL